MKQADAAAKCDMEGAKLVTIQTEEEDNFLGGLFDKARDDGILATGSRNVLNTDIWVGAMRTSVYTPFYWSSGEPVNYTNWHQGHPKDLWPYNGGALALCIQSFRNNGNAWKWGTSNCDGLDIDNAYACEKEGTI